MPITCSAELVPFGQEAFHDLDRQVMRHVFDIHNTIGRFCDERIYQEELAQRCRGEGISVEREVQLKVSHKNFSKPYYLDLLLASGVIYELNAVTTVTAGHESQLINYLLLADLFHGKLVNFRPPSVESRFVSTSLRRGDRQVFNVVDNRWDVGDAAGVRLREALVCLLRDWGMFLDTHLYREALLHFLDGPDAGLQEVNIEMSGRVVGTQKMCLLNPGTAWHLSTVRRALSTYETHIARLLHHTPLERMHWINLNRNQVTLATLSNHSVEK